MIYKYITLIFAVGLALFATGAAQAQSRTEHCVHTGATQFYENMSTCVTSRLSAQGTNRYGPEQFDNERGAWCEGTPGDGVHEEIRFYFVYASSPRRFFIRNGYIKSAKSFQTNSRVAVMRMRDDAGNVKDVYLEDSPFEQFIQVPWEREYIDWIQFEIIKVYRGSKYRDTCISSFGPDFEDF